MNQEINIIEIIKAQRYFKEALKLLLDRGKRLELIKSS